MLKMQTIASSNGNQNGALSTSLNNNGVPLNLDHYKFIRSILPNIPHCIESLHFNDLNSWDCSLSVSLRTESDCLKWLTEFQDNTRTDWKVDSNLALSCSGSSTKEHKVRWGMVYRCCPVPPEISHKLCTAKLEIKVLAFSPNEKITSKQKQYPSSVTVSFCHNHELALSNNNVGTVSTIPSSVMSPTPSATTDPTETMLNDSYKLQGLSTHQSLKEEFDGYFDLPTTISNNHASPVIATSTTTDNSQVNSVSPAAILQPPSNLNLSAIQLQPQQPQQQANPNLGHPQPQLVILPEQGRQQPSHSENRFNSEVFDLADVSHKLDEVLGFLKTMLKQPSGTAIAAVKQFSDSFERLKSNDEALEMALCNFGTNIQLPSPPTVTFTPQPTPPTIPQWSMTVPTVEQNGVCTPAPIQDEALSAEAMKVLKKIKKKRKKGGPDVLPGQIDPITGKRKKRSRCGTCQGCINRDKTQDCRVCRNCLDQKRYGGPGRLKKACVKRSCIIMATTEGQAPLPQQSQPQTPSLGGNPISNLPSVSVMSAMGNPTTIALPLHPVPVSLAQQTIHSTANIQLPQQPITLQPIDTVASISSGMSSTVSESTAVLSWPNMSQFAPTFQVQQPVQFTYQPECSIANFSSTNGLTQYSTSSSLSSSNSTSIHLDAIAAEAAKQHGIS